MKKLLGYIVGLGISASVIIGGISTASNVTKSLLDNTKSSAVYEATGDAMNNALYGFMGAVSGNNNGINLSTTKNDILNIGSSLLTGSSSKSKATKATHIEGFKPSENPNYVEGFH